MFLLYLKICVCLVLNGKVSFSGFVFLVFDFCVDFVW